MKAMGSEKTLDCTGVKWWKLTNHQVSTSSSFLGMDLEVILLVSSGCFREITDSRMQITVVGAKGWAV